MKKIIFFVIVLLTLTMIMPAIAYTTLKTMTGTIDFAGNNISPGDPLTSHGWTNFGFAYGNPSDSAGQIVGYSDGTDILINSTYILIEFADGYYYVNLTDVGLPSSNTYSVVYNFTPVYSNYYHAVPISLGGCGFSGYFIDNLNVQANQGNSYPDGGWTNSDCTGNGIEIPVYGTMDGEVNGGLTGTTLQLAITFDNGLFSYYDNGRKVHEFSSSKTPSTIVVGTYLVFHSNYEGITKIHSISICDDANGCGLLNPAPFVSLNEDFENGGAYINFTRWKTKNAMRASNTFAHTGIYSQVFDSGGMNDNMSYRLSLMDYDWQGVNLSYWVYEDYSTYDVPNNYGFLDTICNINFSISSGFPVANEWGYRDESGTWFSTNLSSNSSATSIKDQWVELNFLYDNSTDSIVWTINGIRSITRTEVGGDCDYLEYSIGSSNLEIYYDDISITEYVPQPATNESEDNETPTEDNSTENTPLCQMDTPYGENSIFEVLGCQQNLPGSVYDTLFSPPITDSSGNLLLFPVYNAGMGVKLDGNNLSIIANISKTDDLECIYWATQINASHAILARWANCESPRVTYLLLYDADNMEVTGKYAESFTGHSYIQVEYDGGDYLYVLNQYYQQHQLIKLSADTFEEIATTGNWSSTVQYFTLDLNNGFAFVTTAPGVIVKVYLSNMTIAEQKGADYLYGTPLAIGARKELVVGWYEEQLVVEKFSYSGSIEKNLSVQFNDTEAIAWMIYDSDRDLIILSEDKSYYWNELNNSILMLYAENLSIKDRITLPTEDPFGFYGLILRDKILYASSSQVTDDFTSNMVYKLNTSWNDAAEVPEELENELQSEPSQTPLPPASGGGGYNNCIADWKCSEWSECAESGTRTRTCTLTNNCWNTFVKPPEKQRCKFSALIKPELKEMQQGADAGQKVGLENSDWEASQVDKKNTIPILKKSNLFDIGADLARTEIVEGDLLTARIFLINFGQSGSTPVTLNYQIVDDRGNSVLNENQNITVYTQTEFIKSINISHLSNGYYTFIADLDYEDKAAPARFRKAFTVDKLIAASTILGTWFRNFLFLIAVILMGRIFWKSREWMKNEYLTFTDNIKEP